MTFNEIYTLSEYLPEKSRAYSALEIERSDSNNTYEVNRFAVCYRDLSFLWTFVKSFSDYGKRIPTECQNLGDDIYELLVRVQQCELYKQKDPHLSHAIAIDRLLDGFHKNTIQGCLMAQDFELDYVAKRTGLPKEVIYLYEKVFFNILDRREEAMFMASIAYPDTRIAEFAPEHELNASNAQLLRQSGYQNGVDDVLKMAGIRDPRGLADTASIIKDFEKVLMGNAQFLARNGFANRNHIGISMAKNLLAAAKHGGDMDGASDSDEALPGDVGATLMDEITHNSRQELAARKEYLTSMNAGQDDL